MQPGTTFFPRFFFLKILYIYRAAISESSPRHWIFTAEGTESYLEMIRTPISLSEKEKVVVG